MVVTNLEKGELCFHRFTRDWTSRDSQHAGATNCLGGTWGNQTFRTDLEIEQKLAHRPADRLGCDLAGSLRGDACTRKFATWAAAGLFAIWLVAPCFRRGSTTLSYAAAIKFCKRATHYKSVSYSWGLELVTDVLSDPRNTPPNFARAELGDTHQRLQTSGMQMLLKARMQQTWDKALETVAVDGPALPTQDKAMLALVRTNHHMRHLSHFDELLRSILVDTVGALNAHRACIILANNETGELQLKATYNAVQGGGPQVRPFSKTLARRRFGGGESLLCDNVDAEETLGRAAACVQSRWRPSSVCSYARRESVSACCIWIAASSTIRSPKTSFTMPTRSGPASPSALKPHKWSRISGNNAFRRSRP